jgi:predicted  nucleic acid-binding Zn-ribbon protein
MDALQQSLTALQEEERSRAQDLQAWRDKIKEAEQTRSTLAVQINQVKKQLRNKNYALHQRRAELAEGIVQSEVSRLETYKAELEEEMRLVMARVTQENEALRRAEAEVPTQQKERQQTASSLLEQIAVVEKELRVTRDERAVLTVGIAPFLLQEYERIFSRRGEVAVVALADETCQGCHMHLPLQMCMDLQRHPRLTFCPHCHRILFVSLGTGLSMVEPCSVTDNANGRRALQPQGRAKAKARTSKKPSEAELSSASPVQA